MPEWWVYSTWRPTGKVRKVDLNVEWVDPPPWRRDITTVSEIKPAIEGALKSSLVDVVRVPSVEPVLIFRITTRKLEPGEGSDDGWDWTTRQKPKQEYTLAPPFVPLCDMRKIASYWDETTWGNEFFWINRELYESHQLILQDVRPPDRRMVVGPHAMCVDLRQSSEELLRFMREFPEFQVAIDAFLLRGEPDERFF